MLNVMIHFKVMSASLVAWVVNVSESLQYVNVSDICISMPVAKCGGSQTLFLVKFCEGEAPDQAAALFGTIQNSEHCSILDT